MCNLFFFEITECEPWSYRYSYLLLDCCRGGGVCVPLWPWEQCRPEQQLQVGSPMPDWSTGRGPTKCSQCLFGSRNQATVLWQASLSTLWQNIVSGTHKCEWQYRASSVCYCGATEQHTSRHAHSFRWIKCCVGPEGNVCPGEARIYH